MSMYAAHNEGGDPHVYSSSRADSAVLTSGSMSATGPTDDVTAPGDITKSSSTLRPKEKRTLWIGDLDRAEGPVDDIYVKTHMFYEFSSCITTVRICRDRISRQPSFGFVEFVSQKEAQYVLEHMNGRFVPGRMHKYRLNWANFNLTDTPEPRTTYSRPAQLNRNKYEDAGERGQETGRRPGLVGARGSTCPENSTSIWVGSLDPSTCREEVEELFEQHYNSVCLVKLIMDQNTGICKGFGFVHFRDPEEAERSLEEMNGAVCRGRRIRINRSNNSRAASGGGYLNNTDPSLCNAMHKIYSATANEAQRMATEYCGGFVPTKRKRGVLTHGETAKVLVRGLDPSCSEDELRRHFSPFGEVLLVRVSPGGKAYITFAEPAAAANTLHCLNGASIGTVQVTVEPASYQQGEGIAEQGVGSQAYYGAAGAEWQGEGHAQTHAAAIEQQQAIQAAQYAQYYQMHHAAYAGIAYGGQKPQAPGSKTKAPPTEEDLDGGIFRDTDPSLVPSELLPPCMFTLNAITAKGSLERHAFRPISPCQARVQKDDMERFDVEEIENEQKTCVATIDGALRKRLKAKVVHGLPLQPEDQEYLYSTAFDGSVVCY